MKKSILAVFVLTLAIYSCEKQVNDKQSTDIGSVVYVKNPDGSGNLIANWAYSPNDSTTVVGTGYTTQSPNSQNFEGKYKIFYRGNNVDSFSLLINKDTSINSSIFYQVDWINLTTGAKVYHGTGIEKDSQLIVGWRK